MSRPTKALAAILTAAFVLRAATRLWTGEADFLDNGYQFYLRIARTFIEGGGLCVTPGITCTARVPVYPLLLAPFEALGFVYPGIVMLQAAIGAATAWVAWAIGVELFNRRAGVIAAAFTAFNPYAIVHDTALQETSVVNCLVVLAALLLLRLRKAPSPSRSVLAGLSLAFAVLTTARVMLLLPAAILWTWFNGGPTAEARLRHAAVVTLIVLVGLGGWTMRNWRLRGTLTLTTETGRALWMANNEWTFTHFPVRSIDLSASESYARLSVVQQEQLATAGLDEVALDRLHARWAAEEVAAHGARSVSYAARKLWVTVSGQLSPARGLAVQASYAMLFVPIHLLAFVGAWRARRDWRAHALLCSIFFSFMITTAIFWAHTSHKSYLDPFLFVYAAAALDAAYGRAVVPLRHARAQVA